MNDDAQILARLRDAERRIEDLEREVARLKKLAATLAQAGREVSMRGS